MKINAVISPHNLKNDNLKKLSTSIVTVIVSLLSIICGVLFYIAFSEKIQSSINDLFVEFFNEFIMKSKPEIFTGLLLNALGFFIIIFLFSTSIIGLPLIYAALATKLISLAVLVSFIYAELGLKGIEYCILILFPGKFLLISGMLIATDSCVDVCRYISQKGNDVKPDLTKLLIRISLIMCFLCISASVDFMTLSVFSGLFDF